MEPRSKDVKTAKIKILVAVGSNGDWAASGWGLKGKAPDKRSIESMKDTVTDMVEAEDYQYVWVEAEVTVPEIGTVFGSVINTEPSR